MSEREPNLYVPLDVPLCTTRSNEPQLVSWQRMDEPSGPPPSTVAGDCPSCGGPIRPSLEVSIVYRCGGCLARWLPTVIKKETEP